MTKTKSRTRKARFKVGDIVLDHGDTSTRMWEAEAMSGSKLLSKAQSNLVSYLSIALSCSPEFVTNAAIGDHKATIDFYRKALHKKLDHALMELTQEPRR